MWVLAVILWALYGDGMGNTLVHSKSPDDTELAELLTTLLKAG